MDPIRWVRRPLACLVGLLLLAAVMVAAPARPAEAAELPPAGPIVLTGIGGSSTFGTLDETYPGPNEPYECDDGINNDVDPFTGVAQDTAVDWAEDPGCESGPGQPESSDDNEAANLNQPRQTIRLAGTIDAAGAMTFELANIRLPNQIYYSDGEPPGSQISVELDATGDAFGSIDPASGETSLTIPVSLLVWGPSTETCATAPFDITLSTDPATAGGHPTAPYDPATGKMSLSDATFAVPATANGILPPAACDPFNVPAGLPAAIGNHLAVELTTEPVELHEPPVLAFGQQTIREAGRQGVFVPATIPVVLSRPVAEDVVVHYVTAPTVDFLPAPGVVTIPAGETHAQIVIWVKGDGFIESNERGAIEVTAVDGPVSVSWSRTTFVIQNSNPGATGLTVSDVSIPEPDGPAPGQLALGWATISLPDLATEPVTVEWSTRPGTAHIPEDLLPRSGTLVIPAGKAFGRVPVWVRVSGDQGGAGTGERATIEIDSASVPVDDPTGIVTTMPM